MKTKKTNKLLPKLLGALTLLAGIPADGQVAPGGAVTASATPVPAETAIELSPFEVHADRDRGYYGANTMSRARLDSKLEDLVLLR